MDRLLENTKSKTVTTTTRYQNLNSTKIYCLLYADDTALIIDRDKENSNQEADLQTNVKKKYTGNWEEKAKDQGRNE